MTRWSGNAMRATFSKRSICPSVPEPLCRTLRDVEYPMSARVVLLAQSGDLRLRRGAPAQGFDPFVGRGALHEVFYFHFFSCLICIRFDGQKTVFLYKYNQKRNKIQMPFLMTKLHRTHGALLRPEKPFTAPTNALPGPRGTLWRPFLLHSRSGIRRLPPPWQGITRASGLTWHARPTARDAGDVPPVRRAARTYRFVHRVSREALATPPGKMRCPALRAEGRTAGAARKSTPRVGRPSAREGPCAARLPRRKRTPAEKHFTSRESSSTAPIHPMGVSKYCTYFIVFFFLPDTSPAKITGRGIRTSRFPHLSTEAMHKRRKKQENRFHARHLPRDSYFYLAFARALLGPLRRATTREYKVCSKNNRPKTARRKHGKNHLSYRRGGLHRLAHGGRAPTERF